MKTIQVIENQDLENLNSKIENLTQMVASLTTFGKPDSYLSKEDVLNYTGNISKSTLDSWLRKGLPHIKLDRRVLIQKSDLDNFLNSQKISRK